jgi:hypothetical protein
MGTAITVMDIQDSFTASFWLKDALRDALKRDCLDAARDAEVLAKVLRARCDNILYGSRGGE